MCHVLALLVPHNRTKTGWVCLHNFVCLKPVLCLSFTWIADIVLALLYICTDCTETNTSMLHTFFYCTVSLIDVHEQDKKKNNLDNVCALAD